MAARVMKSPTASRGEVVVSLIQQRLALRRQRLWGLFSLIIGLLGVAAGAAMFAASPDRSSSWWMMAVWAGWGPFGAVTLIRYRRRVEVFEAEHGKGAGEQ